jgi:hypothetical protein
MNFRPSLSSLCVFAALREIFLRLLFVFGRAKEILRFANFASFCSK